VTKSVTDVETSVTDLVTLALGVLYKIQHIVTKSVTDVESYIVHREPL
jgi:hypothetical protein